MTSKALSLIVCDPVRCGQYYKISTVQTRILVIYFSYMYFAYKASTCMKNKSLVFESAR